MNEPIKTYKNGYYKAHHIDDFPEMRQEGYLPRAYDEEKYVLVNDANIVVCYFNTFEDLDKWAMENLE